MNGHLGDPNLPMTSAGQDDWSLGNVESEKQLTVFPLLEQTVMPQHVPYLM